MKWVLMAVIFVICVFIGVIFSSKYKKRVQFFSALILLAQKLDVEINYSRERLKKLIESFDEKSKKNLLGVDIAFLEYLDKGGELTSEKLFKKSGILKTEEKETVTLFFKNLGRSDVENQTKEIKNSLSRFEKLQSDATNDNKKYGTLGTKLGIITGLVIAILLI